MKTIDALSFLAAEVFRASRQGGEGVGSRVMAALLDVARAEAFDAEAPVAKVLREDSLEEETDWRYFMVELTETTED